MTQFASFGVGKGFVLHKVIVGGSKCRYSVWVNHKGGILSAEGFRPDGKSFNPVVGGPVWTGLQAAATAYYDRNKDKV